MAKNEHIALKADPNDPEDFDVTEAALERALAERRERLAQQGLESITLTVDKVALDRLRANGPGWEFQVNEAVRKAAGL